MSKNFSSGYSLKGNIKYDLFTGLYTKKHFEYTVENLISDNQATDYIFVTANIDRLKKISDIRYNKIILSISLLLTKHAFPSAYEENEFLMFIPKEELDNTVNEISAVNSRDIHITFGKSIFPLQGTNYKALYEKAGLSLKEINA